MHRERHEEPVILGTTAKGRTAPADVRAAAAFGGQALLVIALLALAILLLERMILAYPERLGTAVSGFPWDRIVELKVTGAVL